MMLGRENEHVWDKLDPENGKILPKTGNKNNLKRECSSKKIGVK